MNHSPINVLVAEDEILLLRNMKKKILSVSQDFQITGEAFNGKEALEIMEKSCPDIVFTDIRMPIMDGLELAKTICEKYPSVYVIIVSGYDDFEYARTAIRYRVHDYLLKPLKMDALEKLLNSLKKKILENRKIRFYSALSQKLNSQPVSHPASADTEEEIPGFLKNRGFSCFLICLGSLHLHCQPLLEKAGHQEPWENISWDFLFDDAALSLSDYWVFPQQFSNIKLLLTENLIQNPAEAAFFIYHSLSAQLPGEKITLIFSHRPALSSQLHNERILLRRQLFASLKIGHSAVIALSEDRPALPPAVLATSVINHLHSLIESNNSAGFAQTVRQLFTEWDEQQYSQQWIEKVLLQLFNLLQRCLYFSDEDYERLHSSVFYALETSPSLPAAAEPIISEFLYWISLNKSVPTEIEAVVEEMDAYIRFHYKEAINISELAEKYHFNHSYLTRVFKKQKGQSPLKLINELRINDAGRLLLTTSLSVREISEMLGFTDQHYFSRIFKDFTGLTPKEYRTGSN